MPINLTDITDKQQNHCIKSLLPAVLMIFILLFGHKSNLTASDQTTKARKFAVTIDAGHGGKDPGAVGKHSKEKNLALAIALKLGQYIENQMEDVSVFYTRKNDTFVELYERAQIANRNKSDLFISIHVNSVKKGYPVGTSTYVMGFSRSAKNLDLVMQENQAMLFEDDYKTRYAGFDPNDVQSYILGNNVQNNNLSQSLELAAAVQDHFRNVAKREDMGVQQGNLVVLWGCAIPAILVETGFICTPKEEAFLMSESGQDIIAASIYSAFRQYKESVDTKVSDATKTESTVKDSVKRPAKSEKLTVDENTLARMVADQKEAEKKEAEQMAAGEKTIESKASELNTKQSDTPPANLTDNNIEFRIQVLASVKKLPPSAKEFKGVKNLQELKLDGYYKYMTKPVTDYKEALKIRRQLSAAFSGAFVVAFKNGKKVPLTSVVDLKK